MIDANNRPGGATLILTAKSANKFSGSMPGRSHTFPISTCQLRRTS